MKRVLGVLLILSILFSFRGYTSLAGASMLDLSKKENTAFGNAVKDNNNADKEMEPKLVLDVAVNNNSKTNVTYKAKLVNVPASVATSARALKVDFYTASRPYAAIFPTKYLGSAYADHNGIAELSVHQEADKYAGGALCIIVNGQKLLSNIVSYEVKGQTAVKPKLVLDVAVNGENTGAAKVTYTAKLSRDVVSRDVTSDSTDNSFTETEQNNFDEIKIDFFTGNPYDKTFPKEYIGSAYLANGKATLSIEQKAGKYNGGAIAVKTPWGEITSNVVMYEVPAAQEKPSLYLEVFVLNNSKENVVYKTTLKAPNAEIPGAEKKLAKIDYYTELIGNSTRNSAFPGKYLGSAYLDENGVAKLAVHQEAGAYIGGAVWISTPWGRILSNTTVYKVPAVQALPYSTEANPEPVKPEIVQTTLVKPPAIQSATVETSAAKPQMTQAELLKPEAGNTYANIDSVNSGTEQAGLAQASNQDMSANPEPVHKAFNPFYWLNKLLNYFKK